MSVLALQKDIADSNRRTRRMTGWSLAVHAVALLLWLVYHQVSPQVPSLVEVEWIEPEPIVAAGPPPVVDEEPVEQTETLPPAPVEEQAQRFERPDVAAETEPTPQRPEAADDRLRARLDRLKAPSRSAPTLDLSRPERSESVRPALARSTARTRTPAALERSVPSDSPSAPAKLERSSRATPAPNLARVRTPQVESNQPRMAEVDESTARRSLEGALLVGPVADRPLRDRTMPEYPIRARQEGIEASVTLSFMVAPDGSVRPNVVVQKTSGHDDFDRNARQALRAWSFAALEGSGGDQWGTITFHFRLRDE